MGALLLLPMSACRAGFCLKTRQIGLLSTLPDKMKSRPRVVLSCEQKTPFFNEMTENAFFNQF